MLWGASDGGLELRRDGKGGVRLSGRFPYNSTAVLSDGGRNGRPRKERIAPRAFAHRVDNPEERIDLLVGHDFNRPIASRANGTLDIEDTAEALIIEARITPEIAATSHGRDALAMVDAGLSVGLSPGFRLPPERAVPRSLAETIEEEPIRPDEGMHGALIRTVRQALLMEVSIVTRPAYPDAQVEARSWAVTAAPRRRGLLL